MADDIVAPADIVAFIRAQLDEDERAALSAGADRWDHEVPRMVHHALQHPRDKSRYVAGVEQDQVAVHIARWDPARVLAEVQAKRKILELHKPAGIPGGPPYQWGCSVCHRRDGWWSGEYPCRTVRLLAAPFAGEPGWDPSWAV